MTTTRTTLADLRAATLEARKATGAPVSTRVLRGLFQVVACTPSKRGRFDVSPLSKYSTAADTIATLRGIASRQAAS